MNQSFPGAAQTVGMRAVSFADSTGAPLHSYTIYAEQPPQIFHDERKQEFDDEDEEDKYTKDEEENILEKLSKGVASMVESTRFNLGLPPFPVSWNPLLNSKRLRRSQAEKEQRKLKLGDVSTPHPEQEQNYEPPPSTFTRTDHVGYLCGVGITFAFDEDEDALVVTSLVEGGPAWKSSVVQVGDLLVEVDGIVVYSQPLDVVHSIIKGQEGSACRMIFRRKISQVPVDDSSFLAMSHDGEAYNVPVTLMRERMPQISDYMAPIRAGVGITFECNALDGSARVKALVRGSEAEASGLIKVGDILFEVDRTSVFREPLDQIAALIAGAPDTKVRLLFLRGTRIFTEVILTRTAATRMSDMASILLHAQNTKRIINTREVQRVKEGEEDLSFMLTLDQHGVAGGGDSMMALKAVERLRTLPEGVSRSSSYKSLKSVASIRSNQSKSQM